MTNQNKLIIGGVALLLVFYLYDRSKKMKAKAELKAEAEKMAMQKTIAKNQFKASGNKSNSISNLSTVVDYG